MTIRIARLVPRTSIIFLFSGVMVCLPAPAFAKRTALVIGNSAYSHAGLLENPRNDARAMAQALQRIGFHETRLLENLGNHQTRDVLRSFASSAAAAEVALVYYAGHGLEIDGQNYIVPVDATLQSDRDIPFEAVPLDLVLQSVDGASRLRLVMLDACRNNPFLSRMARTAQASPNQTRGAVRSLGRGLASVEPPPNTMVVYAAKHGQVAADGSGVNSPFATAVLRHITTPGLDVGFLFRRVRDDVLVATRNLQEPFSYGSLSGENHFLVPPTSTVMPSLSPDVTAWLAIKDSASREELEKYLADHPYGAFAAEARSRLAAPATSTAAPPPAAELQEPKSTGGFLDWLRRNSGNANAGGSRDGGENSSSGAGGSSGGSSSGGNGGGGGGGRGGL